ncbi:MAG: ArnT family glycosyltransferase [Luteibaculum sp.]
MNLLFSSLQKHYEKNPNVWYLSLFILGFLIYHQNLGYIPLRADEPTRTIVALEMMISGNYITPTINGEWYYRKPPLFNWLLIAIMNITGSKSDFVLRLACTVPLFLFGLTIFLHAKKYIHHAAAFLAAAMFVTCGRMLIYASFLGHIDVFYSWITYLAFIALFEYAKKEQWTKALFISYLLHTIAFLCKGLPSVLFAGLSAVAVIIYFASWKKVFGWRHLLAALMFFTGIASYFYIYSQYNSLEGWVTQLWDQSAQRTVMDEDRSWWDTLINLFKFPADHIMHLAPWSIFAPVIFFKGFWKALKANPFLSVFGLIFAINIPVYWLSPGYYPRYLFMLYPIFFVFLAYFLNKWEDSRYVRSVNKVLLILTLLAIPAPIAVFFVDFEVNYAVLKVSVSVIFALLAALAFWKMPRLRMLSLVFVLLVLRFMFNMFVQDHRMQTGPHEVYKNGAIEAATIAGPNPLYVFTGTPINHQTTWYVEKTRMEILRIRKDIESGCYYMVYEGSKAYWPTNAAYEDMYRFKTKWEDTEITLRKAL